MNFCQEYAGRLPEKLIDVQLAAGLVGLGYPLSLDNLLQKTVKAGKLKKTETRTDWRKRPLTMTQVDYALDDVRYLLEVRKKLGDKMESLGRAKWLEEETQRFLATTARRADDRWTRVSGAGGLRGLELAVFRELVNWRNDRAKRVNKPSRWVLRDDLLAELAKRQPKTVRELQAMRGVGGVAASDVGGEIVEAIQRGLELPSENWPARPKRRDPSEEQMVVKILSAALDSRRAGSQRRAVAARRQRRPEGLRATRPRSQRERFAAQTRDWLAEGSLRRLSSRPDPRQGPPPHLRRERQALARVRG